ncbi:G2/M phase-specific E3 ubiquitin-protein ligase-like [Haliotis rubra]|uniref:G2/M phase-specific E3 ubiquitin-protein ligase-like n=1 Tax=Haliotis rubra TaxID=36100 RepID=UPI001EE58366|nr:G2/M phase-specific E3 ubiquitin-protein ligase-like [Haliotis rubra]
MKEVFEYEKRLLDSTTIELLFEADLAKANSNRHRQEEIVLSNWRDFLLDLEEGTEVPTLKDLLVFVTGADGIPPLGFDPSPRLLFHSADIESPEDKKNFLFANTCANSLSLPMLVDYELFKKNMVAAIQIKLFTTE